MHKIWGALSDNQRKNITRTLCVERKDYLFHRALDKDSRNEMITYMTEIAEEKDIKDQLPPNMMDLFWSNTA